MEDPASLTSGADEEYFRGLQSGEVRLQFCQGCNEPHWPAVFRCPDCGSWEQDWRRVKPSGKIYSWTRSWHAFGGLEGFELPFVSVVVELDEVPSIRLLGVLNAAREDVRIGDHVRAHTVKVKFGEREIPALQWSSYGEET